ncbi:hypothetical protein ACQ4PT_054097 [Festuca glaucescens]
MAAALRLLLRQHAAAPPSPMLRSLFPAPYSKAAAAAAAASLPATRGAPLSPPCLREVTPRKAPPPPKGELRCCRTVPSTMTDSTKSLPDKLRHLKDGKKSLQDMEKNLEEHEEMIRKALHDRKVANDLFSKRLDDRQKLLAKISNVPDDYVETHDCHDVLTKINSMQDDLAKVEKMRVDYDKDWDIQEAKARVFDEQMEMLCKKREDYITAFRKRLDDRQELLDKLRNLQDDYGKARNMRDGLAKVSKMKDDFDRDQAIERAKCILIGEQMEVLREKHQDYLSALRRYHELERSTMEQVEKVKKVVKVGAAVGLVGGLLLILAKI